jgi:hypothetical protein
MVCCNQGGKLGTGEFFALSNAGSVHFRAKGPVRPAQTCDAGRAGARPYRRLGGSASYQRKVGKASLLCTLQNRATETVRLRRSQLATLRPLSWRLCPLRSTLLREAKL